MRIVFIIDQVYQHGGIERVLSIKANYLSSIKNNTVYILTTEQRGETPCYTFNSEIVFKDLKINYSRAQSYFHPKNLLKIPKHIREVKRSLSTINPDVIVVCSHSVDTYFMPFLLKHIPKIKEFHYSKFIEIEKRKNPSSTFKSWFLKFADYVETQYDALVVLNPDEASYYTSNNTVTIPNPLTFYPDTVSALNENVAIAAGRIAPVKRFDILIDIWELVRKKNNHLKLYIFGEGETKYMESLQKKIIDKNLTDTVFLKGATNQIQTKMLSSSLFLMTSDNECFPLVLLEAQACGLPIISFDCPHGPRNIVTPNSGALIKINDINNFSETVLEIMDNSSKRKELGRCARINASNYSIELIMGKWIALFENLKTKK